MDNEHDGYVAPAYLVDDEFFTRTFGEIITKSSQDRALNDERFAHLVQTEPFHLQLPLTSRFVYGTGERSFDLNLYGRHLTFWNTDPSPYDRGSEPINYAVPFVVIVADDHVQGIFVDNPYHGTVDIGFTDADLLTFSFTGPARGVYTYTGDTLASVIAQFTAQSGRMPMPPLWALGHHQCRYSYMNQREVLAIARQFRRRHIPCDAIYLDIHYMDHYKVFTWDTEAFPDFAGMAAELHAQNIRLVVIVDPGVKIEPGYDGYEDGIAQDVFIKLPDGTRAEGVVWPGNTHHPDFASERVRRWWAEKLQPLLQAGVDGLWNDMNEPLYFGFGEALSPADYLVHDVDGTPAYHAEQHNLYGHQMSMASRLAQEIADPQRRPFNITRAGYAGTQSVASSWTADNTATWDSLRLSIAMTLNMALSGQSFTGPDIGGFAGDTNAELLIRWYQACVLMPFYRNHSAVDTIHQEAWRFGEQAEGLICQAIDLRYTLLPYLYSQFAACHFDGIPIVRPLFAAEPQNPHLRSIDDCYLVGDHMLVAPITTEYALRRTVYLPAGSDWYTFDAQTRYHGGQLISVEAPLNTVPIFVRAGTALPLWSQLQSTPSELPAPHLRLYPGHGETRLYQDAGDGLGYQRGEYAWTTFTLSDDTLTHTITGDQRFSHFTV